MAAIRTYRQDKQQGDEYIKNLKDIMKVEDITIAGVEDDNNNATDLFIRGKRVAFRVRQGDWPKDEFTIRSKRPSGHKTELEKILAGNGDILIYCHASSNERAVIGYMVLIDLNKFRQYVNAGIVEYKSFNNYDGSSSFNVYNLGVLPNDIVLIRWKKK